MRILMLATMTAAALSLAACGGKGDDKLGDQAQEAMENRADALDVAADNMTGAAEDATEAKADAIRETGDAKEEAIDDADVNADAMTTSQKKAVVDGN
ncbi:hypothetical protein [Sphingomonas sp. SRS2]|uniref:hypothetical protein n=1 Tax=Sphingomonas sp. SRS2 TaxID=133190 RepID=UPI0006184B14|nr:hypothetical protein [Sphingomonas sp. SRS2]KKC27407.1 hypothetical protein WP12_03200 [Sphingomonas sp. SRS2]